MHKYIKEGKEKEFWEVVFAFYGLRRNKEDIPSEYIDELLSFVNFKRQHTKSQKQLSELFNLDKKDARTKINFYVKQIVSNANIRFKHHPDKAEIIEKLTEVYKRLYQVDHNTYSNKVFLFTVFILCWVASLFRRASVAKNVEKSDNSSLNDQNLTSLAFNEKNRTERFFPVVANPSKNKKSSKRNSAPVNPFLRNNKSVSQHFERMKADSNLIDHNATKDESKNTIGLLESAEYQTTISRKVRKVFDEVSLEFLDENYNARLIITGHICYTLDIINGYQPMTKFVYMPFENEKLRLKVRDTVGKKNEFRGVAKSISPER